MADLESLLAASGDRKLLAPLVFWHAASLEQLSRSAVLSDPDAASRALSSAQRLYGLDVVAAAPADAVAWAVRGAAAPGAPLAASAAEHPGRPLCQLPDLDALESSKAVAHLEAIVTRLRTLLAGRAKTAVVVPTGAALAASLGPTVDEDWAEDAVGSVLRAIGAAQPEVVFRVGPGERGQLVAGLCDYFDIALVESTGEESEHLASPTAEEFLTGLGAGARLVTTSDEVPAGASPQSVRRVVEDLRTGGAS
ncbi:hypothetical protein SAMN06264364_10778 [Quadrisphaera granulorum]|uniref:Uncharacterized protein n=1 Tax=Quadrisphaera granulorum TaxID=317664 RepID=A0A316AA29_9ACTN|nr:hypothetical protein [Quadrisphaera granulorum]PWJ54382.1 hypothetical protein BXY45_10778 [Quadrisphaera granulorum]SZE96154.1 hypothetical protein SAMN06264364_10778 [Quadrisphaera granulorum]